MPLYEYQCDACAARFERIQKYSDPPIGTCPACGGAVRKLVSSPAIQFKGTGWYITDYAKKSDAAKDKGDKARDKDGQDAAAKSEASSSGDSSSSSSSDSARSSDSPTAAAKPTSASS